MGVVSWALVGMVAGFLTGKYFKNTGSAMIGNVITGLIGGLIGGYLSTTALHLSSGYTDLSLVAMLFSFIVAVAVIIISRLVGQARDKALSE